MVVLGATVSRRSPSRWYARRNYVASTAILLDARDERC